MFICGKSEAYAASYVSRCVLSVEVLLSLFHALYRCTTEHSFCFNMTKLFFLTEKHDLISQKEFYQRKLLSLCLNALTIFGVRPWKCFLRYEE
jgi:hypothetical protein